jgi:hypothetical protein
MLCEYDNGNKRQNSLAISGFESDLALMDKVIFEGRDFGGWGLD